MLAFLCVPVLRAQEPRPNEYQVKAAYLFNFGRFVKWPATPTAGKDDSFTVCVLGQDPFGPVLDSTLAGEDLDGKRVATRRISKPQDAGTCRILFISSE
ncbi:MAG: YfiR family protein, partial [Candidatus Acidiferrales bacterium]